MAVNETHGYGLWEREAEQIDKEILYSMEGRLKKGGVILRGQVLPAGQVLSLDEATGKWIAYNDVADVNEVQTITITGGTTADAGGFKLRFTPPADNQPSGPGPFTTDVISGVGNVTAAEIQTALRALPGLSAVTVTGSDGGPFTVTYLGAYAGTPVDNLEVVDNDLNDGGVAMTPAVTQGTAGVRGGQTAAAILPRAIDSTDGDEHVDLYFAGTFKTAALVGLDANALTDLGAKQNTVYGYTRIG